MDYVAAWYIKAAEYIKGTEITVGFVSTNSITQGEQVGVLWGEMFRRGVRIRFAHRTFAWESEARGKAHVHVVIVGFGMGDADGKRVYDYDHDPNNPVVTVAKNISPYLVEGPDTVIVNRGQPICAGAPVIGIGNKPIDDGNYLFTDEEREHFLSVEPNAARWFRRWLGSDEFLNGWQRWCLWVGECPPQELRAMPEVMKRIEAVRQFRLASKSAPTRKLAETPTRFHVENFPKADYLVIPEVSSERRRYIPIGYLPPSTIASNKLRVMSNASLWHFGVLTSAMHMAWVNRVTGRLKSDYQYSVNLVYNNYPWPASPTDKQRAAVEARAQAVLDARAQFPGSSLADLYDPLTMPPALVKAHADLDRAVELCYRKEPFKSDRERVEFLFGLYEKLTAPLVPPPRGRKRKDG